MQDAFDLTAHVTDFTASNGVPLVIEDQALIAPAACLFAGRT